MKTPAATHNGRPCTWMCVSPDGKQTIEVFENGGACVLAHAGWTVETSYDYLGRINKAIKAENR